MKGVEVTESERKAQLFFKQNEGNQRYNRSLRYGNRTNAHSQTARTVQILCGGRLGGGGVDVEKQTIKHSSFFRRAGKGGYIYSEGRLQHYFLVFRIHIWFQKHHVKNRHWKN